MRGMEGVEGRKRHGERKIRAGEKEGKKSAKKSEARVRPKQEG